MCVFVLWIGFKYFADYSRNINFYFEEDKKLLWESRGEVLRGGVVEFFDVLIGFFSFCGENRL